MEPDFLTLKEAACVLGMTRQAVSYHIERGTIKGVRVGHSASKRPTWRIPRENVEAFQRDTGTIHRVVLDHNPPTPAEIESIGRILLFHLRAGALPAVNQEAMPCGS